MSWWVIVLLAWFAISLAIVMIGLRRGYRAQKRKQRAG
jgi:uncharacterized BrkB/YihY/UPF0761 family membrane protein